MMWMMLNPREIELVRKRVDGETANANIMRIVQQKLDPTTGELELTEGELNEVQTCSRAWSDGYEKELKAILSAADRHS